MKLNPKDYKIIKTKKYLKANKIFFFFSGANQNSQNWIKTEQEFAAKKIVYYKIFNKISNKVFKTSIYKTIKSTINSITFFLKPKMKGKSMSKSVLNINEPFVLLALKINVKIYSAKQIQTINSLTYKTNSLLLYKFIITNIKTLIFSK